MGIISVRPALEADFEDWVAVARDVKKIFRHSTMDTDPAFLEYARRKLRQKDAVTAFDETTGHCVGFVGFSQHFNRITWVGVLESYRGCGIGIALLNAALASLDSTREITVKTYRFDYPAGAPARRLYFRAGFTETSFELYDELGNEICELTLYPASSRLAVKE